LRVPDDLLGKQVKCPGCQTVFTAASSEEDEAHVTRRRPASAPPAREPDEEIQPTRRQRSAPEEDDEDNDESSDEDDLPPRRRPRRRRRSEAQARSQVMPPAICLLVTGILGLLVNGALFVINVATGPQQPPPNQPGMQKETKEAFDMGFKFGQAAAVGATAFCAFLSLVVILGAAQMIRLRMRALAITSSIMAMLIVYPCCCVLGLPFGIWSLVVLNKPEVASAFS